MDSRHNSSNNYCNRYTSQWSSWMHPHISCYRSGPWFSNSNRRLQYSDGNFSYRGCDKQWMLTFANKNIYSNRCMWQYSNSITYCNMDSRCNCPDYNSNRYTSQWKSWLQPNISCD